MGRVSRFSHLSPEGKPRMVDVSAKPATHRSATAEAWVDVGPTIARELRRSGGLAKGEVLNTASLAGTLGAKQTAGLIPLCHPLPLDVVDVDARVIGRRVRIVATVRCEGKTGVEMEAMTAATVAALTVYDMVKSAGLRQPKLGRLRPAKAGRGIEIGPVRLLEKSGGKSGRWIRES
jgi:cyclic pyranopterin phosphate synthase